ncbi:MAG: zinc-ribbon domain-containing protein [Robiginitalea sp.]
MSPSLMFILFFGTRRGKMREAPLPGAVCPYCKQTGHLKATLIPHFIHLFWIPVYRLRPLAYVECAHCKKAYEGSEMTPEMEQAIGMLKSQ